MKKYYVFTVATGSMEPELNIGDYILVKKDNYSVGDIVTYFKDDVYVTHRIIEINDNVVITKGDANDVSDKAITKEDIIGKVIMKLNILNFIYNKNFVILLVILFTIFNFMNVSFKRKKRC